MTKQVAKQPQYTVIETKGFNSPVSLIVCMICTNLFVLSLLFVSSMLFDGPFGNVVMLLGIISFIMAAMWDGSVVRTKLELRAKGLKITSQTENRLIPWDWLKSVEIRYRGFNLFPNYVCFDFSNHTNSSGTLEDILNRKDSLILLEDVLKGMDVTNLIECVRTWAPNASIRGDVWLVKSESIATYTELWLKDLSKNDKRVEHGQRHSEGTILNNDYRIIRVLSSGGQGTAYLASTALEAEPPLWRKAKSQDLRELPPEVVLKEFILPENERGSKKVKESLLREAALLRRIEHPIITRFYDCFTEDLRGYLVTEYCPGVVLKEWVAKNGPVPDTLAITIASQLCNALSYLHGLEPPILHGDVAPDNVILAPDGNIKLLDFAAAQEFSRSRTSTVIGKHAYMAPEQFRGMPEPKSDIYSLGCTTYYLLTATEPEPLTELHPRIVSPTINESLDRLIFMCTQYNAELRPPTAQKVKEQLESIDNGLGTR